LSVADVKKPNPEVFAKTVLSELARLRAEVFATRLRLYQHMMWMRYPQSFEQMESEDKTHVETFQKESLSRTLNECGLSPDPRPPRTPPEDV
jgi:hypothetical protein